VFNGNKPNLGNITEEKESEMEEFISYSKIVVGVLGHKVFEIPVAAKSIKEKEHINNSPNFHFKGKCEANSIITNEGFVILKGSHIIIDIQNSCPKGIKKLREQYKDKVNNNITTTDLVFYSFSAELLL